MPAPLRAAAVWALTVTLIGSAPAWAADRDRLLYHVETLEGAVLETRGADTPFNPASLIKVGTSLWALERLGPDHRFLTVFGVAGEWDKTTGRLAGSLVVQGWGDPDFQAENAFMVARQLNRLRLARVDGDLRLEGQVWVGWENGAERREPDPRARAASMGARLRNLLDPQRWDRSTRAAWDAFCDRRGWDPADPPRVVITGGATYGAPTGWQPVAVHSSNPLAKLLRRFNVYSNNDIIRVADELGGVAGLEGFLEQRLEVPADAVQLQTASGERRNRITARIGVRLMRAFVQTTGRLGLSPGDVLPVIGCDPGATDRKFPKFAGAELSGALAVKTGTLINTDGGVAVLGGVYTSPDLGTVLFCIAAPRSGYQEPHWRSLQQSWLLDLVARTGGAVRRPCGPELPFSDTFASVEWVAPW